VQNLPVFRLPLLYRIGVATKSAQSAKVASKRQKSAVEHPTIALSASSANKTNEKAFGPDAGPACWSSFP
jgi:hypothetical protein